MRPQQMLDMTLRSCLSWRRTELTEARMDEQYQDDAAEIYATAEAVFAALAVAAIGGIAAMALAAWAVL